MIFYGGESNLCPPTDFFSCLGEIANVLSNEASYCDQIRKLEAELSVYKRAYADVDAERRQLEKSKHEADQERALLENQLRVRLCGQYTPY